MRTVGECIVEPVGGKAFADTDHGGATHLERFGDLFIGPSRDRGVAIDLE